jgi:hypothetical protein
MASTSATRKPVGDVRQFCATTKSYTSAGADTPAYRAQNRHAAMGFGPTALDAGLERSRTQPVTHVPIRFR